jgi:DNA mismatch repair protein MutS
MSNKKNISSVSKNEDEEELYGKIDSNGSISVDNDEEDFKEIGGKKGAKKISSKAKEGGLMIQDYFKTQEYYEKIYGKEKTVVFTEVGTFYESYAINNLGHDIESLAPLLDLTCTWRNKKIKETNLSNPRLLGFPTVSTDKYIKMLMDIGYTVILMDQHNISEKSDKKELIRKVSGVYSPATYFGGSENINSDNQYMLCIYLEEEQQFGSIERLISTGISLIDVTIGTSIVHQAFSKKDDKYYSLDEASKFIISYKPKEIIVCVKNIQNEYFNTEDKLIKYLEIDNIPYHYYDINDKLDKNIKEKYIYDELWKVKNQNQYLEKIFPQFKNYNNLSILENLDLENKIYSIVSYLILLNFIYNRDTDLLKKLLPPVIYDDNKHLILGNNAIQQLNVITFNDHTQAANDNSKIKFKSLYEVINKTSTPMGRRLLRSKLLNPITNINDLNRMYKLIECIICDDFKLGFKIEEYLKSMHDLERYHRRLALQKLHPMEFAKLISSYDEISKLLEIICSNKKLTKLFKINENKEYVDNFNEFIDQYKSEFNIDELEKYTLGNITGSFFVPGQHKKIDSLQQEINSINENMNKILEHINSMLFEGKADKKLITLEYNSINKHYIQITKPRAKILQKNIERLNLSKGYSEKEKNKIVKWNELQFLNTSNKKSQENKGNFKLLVPELTELSEKLEDIVNNIGNIIEEEYLSTLSGFYKKYSTTLTYLVNLISEIDFAKSGAKCAFLYNYSKPNIIENDKSYINCSKLRHAIIERINENTEYIPHDVNLGNDVSGMIIFGLNSSGKSSLMKAIGLSVIMAQIGYYVPAEKYEYSPYFGLYARITGNDNILKGLSSFTLEMVELEAILKRTKKHGEKTLVIGDEICRGTESTSGISIVATSIIKLTENNCSFIFASHLHQITKIDQIKNLNNVKFYHLRVTHDEKNDRLIFDRKLTEGPGPEIYGLLVAKYLIKDNSFIEMAESIKKKLLSESDKFMSTKKSKYNSKIYLDHCQICSKVPNYKGELDTHHINFQKDCDCNGKIIDKPYVHKNHKSNLIVLCKDCHRKVHANKIKIDGYLQTSNGPIVNFNYI